jgi:hypothetical protein
MASSFWLELLRLAGIILSLFCDRRFGSLFPALRSPHRYVTSVLDERLKSYRRAVFNLNAFSSSVNDDSHCGSRQHGRQQNHGYEIEYSRRRQHPNGIEDKGKEQLLAMFRIVARANRLAHDGKEPPSTGVRAALSMAASVRVPTFLEIRPVSRVAMSIGSQRKRTAYAARRRYCVR